MSLSNSETSSSRERVAEGLVGSYSAASLLSPVAAMILKATALPWSVLIAVNAGIRMCVVDACESQRVHGGGGGGFVRTAAIVAGAAIVGGQCHCMRERVHK